MASWPGLAQETGGNGSSPLFQRPRPQSLSGQALTPTPTYSAAQIGKIYNILPPSGTCQATIGILELGGGYNRNDLVTYWTSIGMSPAAFPVVNDISIDGAINDISDTWPSTEVTMDVELVGGIAPGATINVYFAKNTNTSFYNAVSRAIVDNCDTILINWGGPESSWGQRSILQQFDSLFRMAVGKGINIFASCGDGGSNDGTNGRMVDFPASSPNVTAVGGTSLYCPNKTYDAATSETVWNNNSDFSSTGGGYSGVFTAPAYQTNNLLNFGPMRGIPDVSATADPNYGTLVYKNGQYYTLGGAEVAAAIWAGYVAQSHLHASLNNLIYSLSPALRSTAFHDITRGSNGAYSAGKGWDPVSGFGSPNGSVLTPLLHPLTVANPASTVLTLTSSIFPPHLGQPVTLTAALSALVNQPTGSIDFYDGATLLGSGPLASGSATLSIATLPLGGHSLTAQYGGDGNHSASASPALDLEVLAPAVVFTVSPGPMTLQAGTAGDAQMTLDGLGTLSGPVAFSVTGLPSGASYEFTPPSITLQGGPSSVSLRILTTAPPALVGTVRDRKHAPWGWGTGTLLACGLLALPSGQRKRIGRSALLALIAVGLLGGLTACGLASRASTRGKSGTPAGTYEITVTASSPGATSAVSTLQVTVTP